MFEVIIMIWNDNIRALREDADLNQTELGKAVCMTQRKISYIECGKYEPDIDDIIALCRFFKVSSETPRASFPRINASGKLYSASHASSPPGSAATIIRYPSRRKV